MSLLHEGDSRNPNIKLVEFEPKLTKNELLTAKREADLRFIEQNPDLPAMQAAKILGHSRTTIAKLKDECGVPRGKVGVPRVRIDRKLLTESYVNQDLSSTETGEVVGCCKNTVIRNLREYGIPVRPPHRPSQLR